MQTICTSLQTANQPNTSSLNFYRPDALPDAQPTVSGHWRHRLSTNKVLMGVLSYERMRCMVWSLWTQRMFSHKNDWSQWSSASCWDSHSTTATLSSQRYACNSQQVAKVRVARGRITAACSDAIHGFLDWHKSECQTENFDRYSQFRAHHSCLLANSSIGNDLAS